jgi:radical SAM superfamily enzyme YgiQ (UPF0313 family)
MGESVSRLWLIDEHRIEVDDATPTLVVRVDGVQQLSLGNDEEGEQPLVVNSRTVIFSRVWHAGALRSDVSVDGVRVPPVAREFHRKDVAVKTMCVRHPQAPAKYKCARCHMAHCAECLAIDEMRCRPCFEHDLGSEPAPTRRSVQLVQINNNYGKQYYLPYSAGVLAAFCLESPLLEATIDFRPFVFRREPVDRIVAAIGQVDVLGVSCYVWNWRLSIAIGEGVRKANPNALIMYGGPQVPDHDKEFFTKYPFVDIAVHGEGEETVRELLARTVRGESLQDVQGLSFHERATGQVTHNPSRPRVRTLAGLPSPYLAGVFDSVMAQTEGFDWMAMWETNRGCPFSCTFCDWGSATASKVMEFDWSRLMGELDWFASHKVGYVFGCDANFGIRKRDIEIARELVRSKQQHGYPKDFRVCFTKNSTDKIFEVAKTFHDAGMLRGVSLSMQSLDQGTLVAIKRDNISLDTFEKLQSRYIEAAVTTYTELILGLPGETYESFVSGIDTLLDRGQHSQILVYNCTVMPNSEMGDPAYQAEHQMRTVEIPIFTAHASRRSDPGDVVEVEPIIIGTRTMTTDDWRRRHHFSWAVQCFHTLGTLQAVALFLHHECGLTYREFYGGLVDFAIARPDGILGRELRILNEVLDRVLVGTGFDQYVEPFEEVTWPPEEAAFLRLSLQRDALFEEVRSFVTELLSRRGVPLDPDLLDDLMNYQKAILVGPRDKGDVVLTLSADIPSCVAAWRAGKPAKLQHTPGMYKIHRGAGFGGDLRLFSREIVWYGRKGGKFMYAVEPLAQESSVGLAALADRPTGPRNLSAGVV